MAARRRRPSRQRASSRGPSRGRRVGTRGRARCVSRLLSDAAGRSGRAKERSVKEVGHRGPPPASSRASSSSSTRDDDTRRPERAATFVTLSSRHERPRKRLENHVLHSWEVGPSRLRRRTRLEEQARTELSCRHGSNRHPVAVAQRLIVPPRRGAAQLRGRSERATSETSRRRVACRSAGGTPYEQGQHRRRLRAHQVTSAWRSRDVDPGHVARVEAVRFRSGPQSRARCRLGPCHRTVAHRCKALSSLAPMARW